MHRHACLELAVSSVIKTETSEQDLFQATSIGGSC